MDINPRVQPSEFRYLPLCHVSLCHVTSCYVVMLHHIFPCATSPLRLTTTEEGSLTQLHCNSIGSCLATVMPWLRQFVAGLPLWRPVFDSRPVRVGFMVDRVALRQVSLRVLWFFPVTIFHQCFPCHYIPPMLHTHSLVHQSWMIYEFGSS